MNFQILLVQEFFSTYIMTLYQLRSLGIYSLLHLNAEKRSMDCHGGLENDEYTSWSAEHILQEIEKK